MQLFKAFFLKNKSIDFTPQRTTYLNIDHNDALVDLGALAQLSSIGFYLHVEGNSSLPNLVGLENVAFRISI